MRFLLGFTPGALAAYVATRPMPPQPFPRPDTPAEYARKM